MLKWGNTEVKAVKWGNTIVFQINGYSNGTFSSPLTGWYRYSSPNWNYISSPSVTATTSITRNDPIQICGTNEIAPDNVPKSTSTNTKYINVVLDWVINGTASNSNTIECWFLIYNAADYPMGTDYITSILTFNLPSKNTYGISFTSAIRVFNNFKSTRRIHFTVSPKQKYPRSESVTLTIKQVNFY